MSKGVFITATDTGVGKTIISGMIVRALVLKGYKTAVMKPFETGCLRQGDNLLPSDGIFLKEMAEIEESIDIITPQKFELPLSPLAASRLEKKTIDMEKVFQSYEYLKTKYDFIVVEGAGGILVPITIEHDSKALFMSDIIRRLGLPIIIVCRPTLGTINHTLLSVNYAINQHINIVGIIINYSKPKGEDISEQTNPDIIRELAPAPLLGITPYIEKPSKEHFDILLNSICKDLFDSIINKISNSKNRCRD